MLMERNKREPFKALGVVVGIVVDNNGRPQYLVEHNSTVRELIA